MSIFRITIYAFIVMIFCIHSTAVSAEAEVNSQILNKVEHYYKINLAKNRGCNWYQVLTAFGHEPNSNPLGCSTEPYTSEMASNKPWAGWNPIRDELARLEELRVEEEVVIEEIVTQPLAEENNKPQIEPVNIQPEQSDVRPSSVENLLEINLDRCDSTSVIEGTDVKCYFKVSPPKTYHVYRHINYKVENLEGSYVEDSDITYRTYISWDSAGQRVIDIKDLSTKDGHGEVRITLLPGEGYQVGSKSSVTIEVLDKQTGPIIEVSSAGCSDFDSIAGHADERNEAVICHFVRTRKWHEDITVYYTLSETSDSGNFIAREGAHIPNENRYWATGRSFTFPKGRHVTSAVVATWTDNNVYNGDSELTLKLDSSGTGYTIGERKEATVTINDEDNGRPIVWIENYRKSFTSSEQSGESVEYILRSTLPGPNETHPVKIKVTQSGFERNLEYNPIIHMSNSSVDFATGSVTWIDDIVNNGTTYVTVELLKSENYIVDGSRNRFRFGIIDDQEDKEPQDIKLGMMDNGSCDLNFSGDIEIEETNSILLCTETRGYDRDTYINFWLEGVQGGFTSNRIGKTSLTRVRIPATESNGETKHITKDIRVSIGDSYNLRNRSIKIGYQGSNPNEYRSGVKSGIKVNNRFHSDNKVIINYLYDPNIKQLDKNIKFRVYPPENYVRDSLSLTAVMTGYRDENHTFKVKNRGQEIWLPVDDGDQVDTIPLDVTFIVAKGDFEIDDNSKRHTLQVADNDPTCLKYKENTLGITLEENSFFKIAQWSFDKSCGKDIGRSDDLELNVEWGLKGCNIVNRPTTDERPDGPIECQLDMVGFDRVSGTKNKFYRKGKIGNGFSMKLQGGTDLDTDDELIRFDPKFTVNSGGEVRIIGAPKYLIAYDTDIPDRALTPVPIYMEFTLSEYVLVENNGPAQPVIRMYYLDENGNKIYSGLVKVCGTDGYCRNEPMIRNKSVFKVKVEGITAKMGEDITVDDPNGEIEVVQPAGLVNNVAVTLSIKQGKPDGKQEGNETFRVSIVEESLPNGFFLRSGDNHSAVFKIIDSDTPSNRGICPIENAKNECAKPTIEIKPNGTEIKEWDGTQEASVKIVSNIDIPNRNYIFEISNYKGNRLHKGEFVNSNKAEVSTPIDLKAGGEQYVQISILEYITQSKGPDEDGVIKIQLKDDPEYKKINSDQVLVTILDQQVDGSFTVTRTSPIIRTRIPTGARSHWTNNENDSENKFIIGPDAALTRNQVYSTEIIIEHPSSTTDTSKHITRNDYELALDPLQENMSLQRQQNGIYLLKVRGTSDNTQTYNCNGESILTSGQACLRYINKRGGMNSSGDAYNIDIKVNKPGRKGTTIGMDYTPGTAAADIISNQQVKPQSLTSTPKTISIEQIDNRTSTKIVESLVYTIVPEPPMSEDNGASNSRDQAFRDYRFDVVIDPPPSPHDDGGFKTTEFQFCIKNTGTGYTPGLDKWADYYDDFRIMDAPDHHAKATTGGRAFKGECTLGSRVNSARTAYYLRVHYDSQDDTDERILLYLKVTNSSTDTVRSTTVPASPAKYIITNDGPMPAEYLKRSGHAKAAHLVDIVKNRISQMLEREPGVTIVPGGSPGDTDPDVILEGAIIEATTRGGITIYTDLSRLNYSGDVGLSGDIKAITIGADKRWENHLLGVGFTTFKSHGEYTGGKISEKSWAAYPYGAYYSHRLTIYGLLAFGEGSMVLNPNAGKETPDRKPAEIGADTTWRSYAVGLEYRLFENERLSSSVFIDHFDQTNKSKTVKGSMEDAEVSTYRTRAGLDTTLTFSDSFSSTFTTSFNKDSFEDVHLSFGTSLNYQMNEKTNINARWNKDGDFNSYGVGLGYTISPGVTATTDYDDNGDIKAGVQGNLSF